VRGEGEVGPEVGLTQDEQRVLFNAYEGGYLWDLTYGLRHDESRSQDDLIEVARRAIRRLVGLGWVELVSARVPRPTSRSETRAS